MTTVRKKKQKPRGTFSMSAKMYARLKEYSEESGEPIAQIVERLLRPVLFPADVPGDDR